MSRKSPKDKKAGPDGWIRVTICINRAQFLKAHKLGKGVVSEGVRKALQAAK